MNPYEQHAQAWADKVRHNEAFSHTYIEKPAMLAKLPNLQGKQVLCVGCGSGEECHELAKRGAKVIGIDNSTELIKIARQSYLDIDFRVMDMERIDLPKHSFDFVYSSLVLHYKADWVKTLKSIATVMKPDATLLFSTIHPVTWSAQEVKQEGHDSVLLGYTKTIEGTIVYGDYFTPRLVHDTWWGFFDVELYIKPLSRMLDEIRSAGFEILDCIEPKATPEGAKADSSQYARYSKLPLFIIFELKLLGSDVS